MIVTQLRFQEGQWLGYDPETIGGEKYQLVLAFGSKELVTQASTYEFLKTVFHQAHIVLSSTAGEIEDISVFDDSIVVTAISFEKTSIRCLEKHLDDLRSSFETGKALMAELNSDDLAGVFVISDGALVNGTELALGFNELNDRDIPVTGGLAGDAARFERTATGLDKVPSEGNVVAIGFYGSNILIGHGSVGGWDEFGRERTITRSDKNVLYEIDGESALKLYKEYLGEYVAELPGSALLFPLAIKNEDTEGKLVRTILGIDEEANSMTFAGNMPIGSKVRLMKANFDRLIEGSSNAATQSFKGLRDQKPQLAILVSCVGRKLILQNRVSEEVEAVRDIVGEDTYVTGFYSYGEMSPLLPTAKCELHNQTMTITTLSEI